MGEQFATWRQSRHNPTNNPKQIEAGCLDCHSPQGATPSAIGGAGLAQLMSYLASDDGGTRKPARVSDASCLQSGCHIKERFQDTEIKIGKSVVFRHKGHFQTESLDGHGDQCSACHAKQSPTKHFEVANETCFLCHLRPDVKNDRLAPCEVCHTVPTTSLQEQISDDDKEKKPITHQSLRDAGVACRGCHYPLIEGTGSVSREACTACHSAEDTLAQWSDGTAARTACADCHPNSHRYQIALLKGGAFEDGTSRTPNLMFTVKTNCTGCHVETRHKDGRTVMAGSGEACADCHTKQHLKMLEDWKTSVAKEVAGVKEVEQEAAEALSAARGRVSDNVLHEAEALIEKGREYVRLVELGNGKFR
jgi:hypothetical protein